MQNSSIEWTDHTFNLVWGCQRVSPGCQHCYAETLAKRYGFDVWGPAKTTPRRTMSANYWKQPLRWNEAARKAGKRARVFCCSMADVFEDHPTNAQERPRLWELIEQTPNLDWLLLTKRPENMIGMAPQSWGRAWPFNVIAMTSVENQEWADKRIPELLKVPAHVRGLSCEPLLGPLDLDAYLYPHFAADDPRHFPHRNGVEWVITGGESGHGARPMHPDWARSLRDQCQAAGVAFHFKQWGEYGPWPEDRVFNPRAEVFQWQRTEWDSDNDHWAVRYEPHYRTGKHAAGRLLDGIEHNGFPS